MPTKETKNLEPPQGVEHERIETPAGEVETRVREAEVEKKKELGQFTEEERKRSLEEAEKLSRELKTRTKSEDAKELFGDFRDAPLDYAGRIRLDEDRQESVKKQLKLHKKKFRFSPPSIAAGSKTATEYDSKAANFSTRTAILILEDGRKIFAVYNYPSSWMHRVLDGFSKLMAGDKMSKASSRDWKRVFEARSNVPIIECDDPDIVLMPYLPNMNAYDLFTRNREIKDVGPCPWAGELGAEGKLQLAEKIVDELSTIHQSGRAWGETILPNIIVTSEKQPVIVDPETQYDAEVDFKEQRARDLKDLILSVSGALAKGEGVTDYRSIVTRLLDRYPDLMVIDELKSVVSKKPSFIQKIFRGSYEAARLGISAKEYQKVVDAILEYK